MRIVWYLARYHHIKISDAGVYRVLKRHGVSRLPGKVGRRAVHTTRYEKKVPGHHIQLDVKFLSFKAKTGATIKRFQYPAIDDATRIRALKIYNKHNQINAIDFVDYVIEKFPFRIHTAVISLVVEMKVGEMIETAMVGRDGVVNGTSALDGKLALHKGIVQIVGAGSVIQADALRSLGNEFEPLRALMIRHEQVLLAQAQQSAGCNASHTVEERMCRWLLRIRDLTGSDEMELTQEFLAQMLGVRRTSVSLVAGTLQKAGCIQYRRGHIKLLDVAALEESACECYETVKDHYARLLVR